MRQQWHGFYYAGSFGEGNRHLFVGTHLQGFYTASNSTEQLKKVASNPHLQWDIMTLSLSQELVIETFDDFMSKSEV
jgi:hypothetical protein